MGSNDTNDPKTTNKTGTSLASPQPQKLFRPSTEEEAVPWAEIILEDESAAASQVLATEAANPLDLQVVGPPLAVLAIVILVFLLLVEM